MTIAPVSVTVKRANGPAQSIHAGSEGNPQWSWNSVHVVQGVEGQGVIVQEGYQSILLRHEHFGQFSIERDIWRLTVTECLSKFQFSTNSAATSSVSTPTVIWMWPAPAVPAGSEV